MDRLHTGCKLHRRCRSVEQSALESYTRQIDNIRFVYIAFFVCAAAVCCCRRRFFPIAFFFSCVFSLFVATGHTIIIFRRAMTTYIFNLISRCAY